MCLATAGSALLVAWLAFALATVVGQRHAESMQSAALAGVLARSSADALQARNRDAATRMLDALRERNPDLDDTAIDDIVLGVYLHRVLALAGLAVVPLLPAWLALAWMALATPASALLAFVAAWIGFSGIQTEG